MQKIQVIEDFAKMAIRSNPALNHIYEDIMKNDTEVYEHGLRVCRLATALTVYYNFNLNDQINIAVGCMLHDVGKLYLDKHILYQQERLAKDERLAIEGHTNLGYKLIKEANVDNAILDIVKMHHELINGKGYPSGANYAQIPIHVQIVTVADIYDTLTAKDNYGDCGSQADTFKKLRAKDGLNTVAVDILIDIVKNMALKTAER